MPERGSLAAGAGSRLTREHGGLTAQARACKRRSSAALCGSPGCSSRGLGRGIRIERQIIRK